MSADDASTPEDVPWPALLRYIDNQEEHHRTKSFKEELLELLEKYDVEYDEKYLWD